MMKNTPGRKTRTGCPRSVSSQEACRPGQVNRRYAGVILGFLLLTSAVFGQTAAGEKEGATKTPDGGYSVAELFNQGNASAHQGKIGLAVLDYERALLLTPGDEDIIYNLHHLRALAKLPEPSPHLVVRVLRRIPPNLAAWLGSLGLILTGLTAWLFRSRSNCGLIFLGGAGLLLVSLALASAAVNWPCLSTAVVTTPAAAARISPSSLAEVTFQFQEGELVTVQSQHTDFSLVQDSSGHEGWIANEDLQRILPP